MGQISNQYEGGNKANYKFHRVRKVKKKKVTYGKAQVLLMMRGEFFQGELINNTSINH